MNTIMQRARTLLGKAMALRRDAEIWWLTLEDHYRTYVSEVFVRLIDEMKPRYIPRRLWNYWHRGLIDD